MNIKKLKDTIKNLKKEFNKNLKNIKEQNFSQVKKTYVKSLTTTLCKFPFSNIRGRHRPLWTVHG